MTLASWFGLLFVLGVLSLLGYGVFRVGQLAVDLFRVYFQ